jgi:hypothetical protein
MSKKLIKETLDFYFSKKKNKDNDYILLLDEEVDVKVVNTKEGSFTFQKTKEVPTRYNIFSNPNKIIKKEEIEKLNPDKIDSKYFWKYAIEKFPNFSISLYPECKNDDDVNKANFNAAIWTGFYDIIKTKIEHTQNCKALEIGPGYGSLFYPLIEKYNNLIYYATDINKLFYYDGLFECNGKSIPKEVGKDFDLMFSFNVFNHLSKKQRTSYYKDVYRKLKKGGKFIFNNFLIINEDENNKKFLDYVDEDGNYYNNFLSQLIIIDFYENLADELNDLGFSINVKLSQGMAIIECEK